MKKKLFFLLCALLTSVGMWANVSFTETYDLTGRDGSDWSSMLKKRTAADKEFDVFVNGTNEHVLVWGGETGSTGLDVGGRGWGTTALAFRNVSKGDKVAITVSDASTLTALALYANSDKVSFTDNGATRTFSVDQDGVSILEFNFPQNGTGVIITQIEYTYELPDGFTKVTSADDLTEANFANNYYLIAAETYPGLALKYNTTRYSGQTDLSYDNIDVENNLYQLWTLDYFSDSNGDGFSMRNIITDHLLLQTENYGAYPIRLNDQPNACTWTQILPASDSNEGFTFQWGAKKSQDDSFFGLWTPSNDYFSGEYLAGNKSDDAQKGHFNIYAIPRATYNALYANLHDDITGLLFNPTMTRTTIGWTQVHSDNYWALGTGLIGTYAVANDKKSTTDATHLNTEYCLGMQCRWSTNYAAFTQNTSTLPAGVYTLTYDVENTNTSTTSANYDNRFYVKVDETQYNDTKTEWMSGKSDWTAHSIEFTLPSATTATISLGYGTGDNNYASGNTPHLYVSHLNLTYTPLADSEDYAALNSAITSVEETHTLGFEDDEYAPYNNVTALEALATAKAINPTVANAKTVVTEARTALTSASWTQNDGAVDIVYNGNFAIANGYNPKGWTRSNGAWGQQITGLTEATNGVDAGTTTAWYYNTEGAWEYGKDGVYTMPLKGNTVYLISFKYRSHATGSNNSMKASITPVGGEKQDLYTFPKNADATMFYGVTAGFKTSTAGNYILSLTQSGNTHLTDVSIVEASSSVAVTLGTNGYATFASPYALDLTALPTGVKAYKAAVAGENVNFTRVDDQSVPAYTGVLLAGTASQDVDINVAASSTAVEDNAFKVNVFGRTFDAAENTKYFGLKANTLTFGLFNPESVAIPNNKAYLTTTTTSARLVISFEDEDPMAINALEASEAEAEGLKDGKYLVKGKIVLVKNGVKFNANGQILK